MLSGVVLSSIALLKVEHPVRSPNEQTAIRMRVSLDVFMVSVWNELLVSGLLG